MRCLDTSMLGRTNGWLPVPHSPANVLSVLAGAAVTQAPRAAVVATDFSRRRYRPVYLILQYLHARVVAEKHPAATASSAATRQGNNNPIMADPEPPPPPHPPVVRFRSRLASVNSRVDKLPNAQALVLQPCRAT